MRHVWLCPGEMLCLGIPYVPRTMGSLGYTCRKLRDCTESPSLVQIYKYRKVEDIRRFAPPFTLQSHQRHKWGRAFHTVALTLWPFTVALTPYYMCSCLQSKLLGIFRKYSFSTIIFVDINSNGESMYELWFINYTHSCSMKISQPQDNPTHQQHEPHPNTHPPYPDVWRVVFNG